MVKIVNILGVTGSIGQSTQKVILAQAERFDVNVISAHNNVRALADAAIALCADIAVITNAEHLPALKEALTGTDIKPSDDIFTALGHRRADVTMAAIMGMAGLLPLMETIKQSDAVAIANKEPLVSAGVQVLQAAREYDCTLLPVDSEHNAIYQVFDPAQRSAVERIVLTASGGAFRGWSRDEMRAVTPKQALKHPTWSMGGKITIDSATMMNKALEVIEACVLFDLPPEKIDVMIHPQSLVHGMVEYCDGSVLAQMGANDMCTPIANILYGGAERLITSGDRLSLDVLQKGLTFAAADHQTYPALALAYEALSIGQYACAALNAANEEAVAAFMGGDIGFLDIVDINAHVMCTAPAKDLPTIEAIISYDNARRGDAKAYIDGLKHKG